ncbi:MAG: recombination regulator RecX [Lachnospiraceae bacterium]|nr:recombination regulator RecX [Lachnospiraceae bacterium]
MEITFKNENMKSKKTAVYADGELIGALYPKEINSYGLEDGADTEVDTVVKIMNEILIPRAKRYVMNLLVKADKTETELNRKLKAAGYGDEVSKKAVEYVRSFHYIDELRTAESFIRTKIDYSSEKEIRYKLEEKGITSETIDMAYEQIFVDEDVENTELKAAENFLKKKLGSSISLEEELPYEERQKLFASAFRKGFRQDSIKKAYNNLMDNA